MTAPWPGESFPIQGPDPCSREGWVEIHVGSQGKQRVQKDGFGEKDYKERENDSSKAEVK